MSKLDESLQLTVRQLPPMERHMAITPLDLRQTRFNRSVRGFNPKEVLAFLEDASADYEEALRENERLRLEVARLEATLGQFRDVQASLNNTLISAQKMADQLRDTAAQDAAEIVSQAEEQAQETIAKAQTRVAEIAREIDGLKVKRRESETGIETVIATLRSALDTVREEPRGVPTRPEVRALQLLPSA